MTRRQKKRRLRQLRREIRRLERRWDEANKRYGAPPRPATDAHYDKLSDMRDEINVLVRELNAGDKP